MGRKGKEKSESKTPRPSVHATTLISPFNTRLLPLSIEDFDNDSDTGHDELQLDYKQLTVEVNRQISPNIQETLFFFCMQRLWVRKFASSPSVNSKTGVLILIH